MNEERVCNLSADEQQEYKTLTGIMAHLRTDEQMKRFGELCGRANYWDQVAISPPVEPTKKVLASIRKVDDEWRAYSSSAYYAAEEHSGYDESGECDSDSFYYLVPDSLKDRAQAVTDDESFDEDWCWVTVKTAPLGEPAGPLLSIDRSD